MKKAILIIVLSVFTVSVSFCQTKQESIKQLFHIMQTDSMTEKMFASMLTPMLNQMQLKDSVTNVHFNEKMNSMMTVMKDITNKMLNEDMVAIYGNHFSQEEINDFIHFYKSPSGQKWTKSTPDITKELMTIMMQKYMPEITKSLTGKVEEKK